MNDLINQATDWLDEGDVSPHDVGIRLGEKWGNGRPAGTPDKLTPPVRRQIARMRAEDRPVSEIADVLRLRRQSVYNAIKMV